MTKQKGYVIIRYKEKGKGETKIENLFEFKDRIDEVMEKREKRKAEKEMTETGLRASVSFIENEFIKNDVKQILFPISGLDLERINTELIKYIAMIVSNDGFSNKEDLIQLMTIVAELGFIEGRNYLI